MLLEPSRELLAQGGLDDALHLSVAEARLCLPLELGLRQFHADDGNEALPGVLAGEVGVVVLQDLLLAGVVVKDAGESGAEAGQVGAAVDRVDAVGEGKSGLVEAVVVLNCDLNDGAFDTAFHVERLVDRAAVLIEAAHERLYAALEVVGNALLGTPVHEVDPDALSQEGHLAEALGKG